MAIKNYLISAVRPIDTGSFKDKRSNLHEIYGEMYRMSVASFKKFVSEDFEPILLTSPVHDVDKLTEENWNEIRDLWHSETCNIFWHGADTIMIRPTSIFTQFSDFRLFNYTDPRTYGNFANYFNDDLRFYSHKMSEATWELGQLLWKFRDEAPDRNWGFDQNRYNHMFWTQNIPMTERLFPSMNWCAMNLRSLDANAVKWHENWNGCSINDARILHFHGSRGADAVINLMKDLCGQLGVSI